MSEKEEVAHAGARRKNKDKRVSNISSYLDVGPRYPWAQCPLSRQATNACVTRGIAILFLPQLPWPQLCSVDENTTMNKIIVQPYSSVPPPNRRSGAAAQLQRYRKFPEPTHVTQRQPPVGENGG